MKIKNWDRFQQYKDRRPPWIKLYRGLLDDFEWFQLSGDDAKALVMLWLMASEDLGNLPNQRDIAFRLRIPLPKIDGLLGRLSHWIELGENEPQEQWPSRYLSDALKKEIFDRDSGKCKECGTEENIEYDHIVPVSKGGLGTFENVQLLCRSCNRRKRTKLSAEQVATQTTGSRTLDKSRGDTEAEKKEAAPDGAPDARTTLFREGLARLGRLTGKPPSPLRSLIGKWLRDADDDAVRVYRAIEDAEINRVAEPVAWITRALKPKDRPQQNFRDAQHESLEAVRETIRRRISGQDDRDADSTVIGFPALAKC